MRTGFIAIILTLPCLAFADDVGTIVAALNDPQAECRYLTEKRVTSRLTIQKSIASMQFYNLTLNPLKTLKSGSKEAQRLITLSDKLHERKQIDELAATHAMTDVLTIESVIRARRGSLDQCQKELEKAPPIPKLGE